MKATRIQPTKNWGNNWVAIPSAKPKRRMISPTITPSASRAAKNARRCRDCYEQYGRRNWVLRSMGYASYGEYLASPLWASIRARVLTRDKRVCFSCLGFATQVHHTDYKRQTIAGTSLDGLVSVCGRCHKRAEVTQDGLKRQPTAATHTLKCTRVKSRLEDYRSRKT